MKNIIIQILVIILLSGINLSAYAQDWGVPFEINPDSLVFEMPNNDKFEKFDSASILVKVSFENVEPKIDWIDIVRVNLFTADTTAYYYINELSLDMTKEQNPVGPEDYPDQLTKLLLDYLQKRLKTMVFKPTKYVDKYRSVPFQIRVQLK